MSGQRGERPEVRPVKGEDIRSIARGFVDLVGAHRPTVVCQHRTVPADLAPAGGDGSSGF
ncbi:hypothetical protein GCM10009682_10960 [Luedemannella flava]|uniref:Uncharacterized protein n=1 Tax=Luedemannella flava TaxID=349316 RepID=A0ABP4XT33_9ACTN